MAPPPIHIQSLGLLEPAGASSDRIASPWRGRDRSASPHPDPVSSTGVVPQPTTPMSGGPLSPSASPGRRHYPNARAEKNSNPIAPPEKRTACPVTPVVPPWMQPDKGVKSSLKTSRRVQDMAGTFNIGNMGVNSLSTTDKTTAQRALSIFNIPSMEITSRKGRLGLHSKSLPPEVFGAAPSQPVESPKRRPRVIVESPEIPCCAMTIQPVVVRPLEKTTRGRLTGPDLRALAEMEEVVQSQQPVPRRSVKEIISVSFKPLMRGGHGGFGESQTSVAQSTTATGNTQSPMSLNTQSPVSLTSEVSAT